jgi:hypothetical protein
MKRAVMAFGSIGGWKFSAPARMASSAGQEPVTSAHSSSRAASNTAQGPDYKVAVTKVSEEHTEDGSVRFDIAYRYHFTKRTTGYIPGLGTVPGSGSFSYLTSGTQLEFRESVSGRS